MQKDMRPVHFELDFENESPLLLSLESIHHVYLGALVNGSLSPLQMVGGLKIVTLVLLIQLSFSVIMLT